MVVAIVVVVADVGSWLASGLAGMLVAVVAGLGVWL